MKTDYDFSYSDTQKYGDLLAVYCSRDDTSKTDLQLKDVNKYCKVLNLKYKQKVYIMLKATSSPNLKKLKKKYNTLIHYISGMKILFLYFDSLYCGKILPALPAVLSLCLSQVGYSEHVAYKWSV